jgi:hypothetical protein
MASLRRPLAPPMGRSAGTDGASHTAGMGIQGVDSVHITIEDGHNATSVRSAQTPTSNAADAADQDGSAAKRPSDRERAFSTTSSSHLSRRSARATRRRRTFCHALQEQAPTYGLWQNSVRKNAAAEAATCSPSASWHRRSSLVQVAVLDLPPACRITRNLIRAVS